MKVKIDVEICSIQDEIEVTCRHRASM